MLRADSFPLVEKKNSNELEGNVTSHVTCLIKRILKRVSIIQSKECFTKGVNVADIYDNLTIIRYA